MTTPNHLDGCDLCAGDLAEACRRFVMRGSTQLCQEHAKLWTDIAPRRIDNSKAVLAWAEVVKEKIEQAVKEVE